LRVSETPVPSSTLKVTEPVGTPDPVAGVTLAVNVTVAPCAAGFGLAESDVVVAIAVELRRNLDTYALSFGWLDV